MANGKGRRFREVASLRAQRVLRGVAKMKLLNAKTVGRITVLLLSLAGCTASGRKFPESDSVTQPVPIDKARMIFYRDTDANFGAATIAVDDSVVGSVSQNGFIVAEVDPGERRLSAWVRTFFHKHTTNLSVDGGRTYYLRVSQRAERSLYPLIPIVGVIVFLADTKGEFQLQLMPESTALQQLRDLRLSE